ncbi:MAG: dihydrodipicolinate synthase family protein [Candidatus Solibacter usitatus]|nr:dihydrodipicolinate synthase family protein [Candidatus Solibacter usitatus]
MWREKLQRGIVIPAHPLALTAERKIDERRQRALTRYYLAAGAGGAAVGVHTTQFEIHEPGRGMFRPVLELAMQEMRGRDAVAVAGIVGATPQAVREAELAIECGYHTGLLSLAALPDASVPELLEHARAVAAVIPLFGFYLQPAVGGRELPVDFWRGFAEIENVVAIKIAPFNRYQTLDVIRAVADSGRASEIALYTGNDDNIVGDLVTPFGFAERTLRMVGGLLGHWAVWTLRAVELLERIHVESASADLLAIGTQITDANAALFDAANQYHGAIAGVHEVLRRQGLLVGRWCLNPAEDLSPGQSQEIDRVCAAYPHLSDDAFVREHLDEWLK